MLEIEHRYGNNIHILDNGFLNAALADLCHAHTVQPRINHLVGLLYQELLLYCLNAQVEKEHFSSDTRMKASEPKATIRSERLKRDQRIVVVNVARAGIFPSHSCFELLHYGFEPEALRQDHIFASRSVDAQDQVTGTVISATKIGGPKEGAWVIIPDPMAATGSTVIAALDHYKSKVPGSAKGFIALHLIVTPEYLRNVTKAHPDLHIYALRLDRGLSSVDVLNSVPGALWDKEKGLNAKGYIVPGGGGFGEIMNNSFV